LCHAKAALIRGGDGPKPYRDVYIGMTLRGGHPYDHKHIRSSEELFSKYKAILSDEQITFIVNCPENVAVTLRAINQSKGKRRMEDWLSTYHKYSQSWNWMKIDFDKFKKMIMEFDG
jgi:hypothetical protein